MPENDIYKILIEYIRDDNEYKLRRAEHDAHVTRKLDTIEAQTAEANLRLKKAEGEITVLQQAHGEEVITSKVNWKWIAAILAAAQFVFVAGFNFFMDWVKAKFIN